MRNQRWALKGAVGSEVVSGSENEGRARVRTHVLAQGAVIGASAHQTGNACIRESAPAATHAARLVNGPLFPLQLRAPAQELSGTLRLDWPG